MNQNATSEKESFKREMGEGFFLKLKDRINDRMQEVNRMFERRQAYLSKAHDLNRNMRVTI